MLLHSGGLAGVDAQTEWTRFMYSSLLSPSQSQRRFGAVTSKYYIIIMLIFVKAPDSESGCEPYGVLGPNQF